MHRPNEDNPHPGKFVASMNWRVGQFLLRATPVVAVLAVLSDWLIPDAPAFWQVLLVWGALCAVLLAKAVFYETVARKLMKLEAWLQEAISNRLDGRR